MAAIRDVVHRVPWTRQPQFPVPIDWSNPITRGLQIAVLPASWAVDLASNSQLTFDSSIVSKDDPQGRGFFFNGTLNAISLSKPISGAYTFFGYVNINATNASRNVILMGTGGAYGSMIRVDTTSWVHAQYTPAQGDVLATETGAVVSGQPTMIAASWDGLASVSMYRGGILRASSAPISMRPVATIQIGQLWSGSIYLQLLWSRALSPVEHASLAANPWQVFLGQSRRIWTAPPAAAVPTLSASTFKPATLTSTGWTPRVTST